MAPLGLTLARTNQTSSHAQPGSRIPVGSLRSLLELPR